MSFIWARDIKGSPPQETFQCGELRPERKLQGALQGLAEKSLQLLKWQNLLQPIGSMCGIYIYIYLSTFTINQPNVGKYHTWILWAYGLILGSSWVLWRSSLGCSEGHRLSTARHHLAKWCQWLLLAARSQNEGPCFFAILPKDCWASTEAIDTGHRRRSLGKEIARFKVEIPQKVTVSTCEANENEWQTFKTSWVWVWYHWMRNTTSSSIQYSHPSFQQEDHLLNWDKQNQFWRKPFYFQHLFNHHLAIWWLTILPDRFWLTWTWCSKPLQLFASWNCQAGRGYPWPQLFKKAKPGEPNAHVKITASSHLTAQSVFPSMWLSWQIDINLWCKSRHLR